MNHIAITKHEFRVNVFVYFFCLLSKMEVPCGECYFPLLQMLINVYEPGDTPLMFAAYSGHENCVKAWIDAGADVNTTNSNGDTALIHASQTGHDKCAVSLLQAGADVNHSNIHGDSALFFAASEGHYNCTKVLIDAGANVNASGDLAWTALSIAASLGHAQCALLLLRGGAFINTSIDDKISSSELGTGLRVVSEEIAILLHAAGQSVALTVSDELGEMFKEYDLSTGLKDLCRHTIRKHLLKLNPQQHLLDKIPQLGLPSLLTRYLLYGVSVDKQNIT